MKIAEIIKTAMRERGITQKELAAQIGYAEQSGVSQVLRSKNPGILTVVRLCRAMGYEVVVRRGSEIWEVEE